MLRKVVSIVTALCFFLTTSGISAQESHAPDIPKLMQAVTDGDTDAMVSLGMAYYEGQGVEKNLELAAAWFRRAALADNLQGMVDYGLVLRNGEGVKWDEGEAMLWFRKAADLGNALAQASLGYGYMKGLGGRTQDYKLAAYWLTKATQGKSQRGEYWLAQLYYRGWGVERDFETAKFLASQSSQGPDQDLASSGKELAEKISSEEEEGRLVVGGLVLGGLLLLLASDSNQSGSQASSSNKSSDSMQHTLDSALQKQREREKNQREYERQQQQDFWRKQKEQYNRSMDCRQSYRTKDRYNERCP